MPGVTRTSATVPPVRAATGVTAWAVTGPAIPAEKVIVVTAGRGPPDTVIAAEGSVCPAGPRAARRLAWKTALAAL